MKRALVTGSFDPVTLGHVNIVERAREMFDEVHFIAFVNPDKSYTFSVEERVEMMRASTSHLSGVKCGYDNGMVYEYVIKNSIDCIVKGARSDEDFKYEEKMAEFNREKSGVDTLILPADPRLSALSSTRIRELISLGESIEEYVGKAVADIISKKQVK